VLVPAHNEADLVERCVASLRNQDYPPDRLQILVIADNGAGVGIATAVGACRSMS
jgi:glycosyltransferase involved in cell wall biosynthesis